MYSPLGEIFNKELEKEDKKKGVLKMLKNIESKNKEQLKAIEWSSKKKKLLDPIKKNNKLEVKKKDHKTKDMIYNRYIEWFLSQFF